MATKKTEIKSPDTIARDEFPGEIVGLHQEIVILREERDSLQAKNEILEEEIRLLQAILYGPSSEKKIASESTAEQPHLPFDEAEVTPVAPEAPSTETVVIKTHSRLKPGRKPLPEHLPRIKDEIDLPDEEKFAPCGCPLKRIGEEISEKLDIVPAEIRVIQTIRYKYAPDCQCGTGVGAPGEVKTAAMPPQIIPQGIVTPGLVAHVVTAKYVDAIPLYRQEQQFMRLGLDITRGTLASWVLLAAAACARLLDLLLQEILSGPAISMDETRVQVLGESGRSNTAQSFMWVIRGGPPDRPGVIFRYETSRAGRIPEELLRGYRGYLQTDGYIGYEAVGEREGIRHLGCWAHARRKFVEVVKGTKGNAKGGVAQEVIDLIKDLYAIEAEGAKRQLSPDDLAALRALESRPILDKIKELLDQKIKITPPRSLLGKAISYTLNQWTRLTVYPENGYLMPDNNLCENAIRPFAVGRNYERFVIMSGSPSLCRFTRKLGMLERQIFTRGERGAPFEFNALPSVRALHNQSPCKNWSKRSFGRYRSGSLFGGLSALRACSCIARSASM